MQAFKFLRNSSIKLNEFNYDEYENVVADLIAHQIVNGLNITDAIRTFTCTLTSHNYELKITDVQSWNDYFRIHYNVQNYDTYTMFRYINEFDYRTINRLVDNARV
jgi:hypothetical protein